MDGADELRSNGLYIHRELSYATAIKEQPVTEQRKPYTPAYGDNLIDAGTARANIAASRESPNGTMEDDYAKTHQHQTVVVQHVEYWDTDRDGIIWPQDTYVGCRKWGWSIPLSALVTFIINFNLSYPTVPGWLPDPFFRIYTQRLYKDKHGSDSMTYDNEGRFKPQQFEDIFAKYDKEGKGGLTWSDAMDLCKGQRLLFDLFGMTASLMEWTATYLFLWPEDGVMRKEDIRGVYDGSIFYKKAEQHQAISQRQKQTSPSLVAKVKKLI
ncbi:hypothetical protein MMC24_000128 [Lignoscripta atroalba]|nr:hypothetical protein [Lignoscripta atroalba]